ncbi:MAG: hypothetical protein Q8P64_02850, partial [Deltaproteobacteria bacterium]|nr:hypothetical protein [Deltaproteobacteria bacterium]
SELALSLSIQKKRPNRRTVNESPRINQLTVFLLIACSSNIPILKKSQYFGELSNVDIKDLLH